MAQGTQPVYLWVPMQAPKKRGITARVKNKLLQNREPAARLASQSQLKVPCWPANVTTAWDLEYRRDCRGSECHGHGQGVCLELCTSTCMQGGDASRRLCVTCGRYLRLPPSHPGTQTAQTCKGQPVQVLSSVPVSPCRGLACSDTPRYRPSVQSPGSTDC